MNADRIMVSPPEYDDVREVLLRLGGPNSNVRQLTEVEMEQLRYPAFLSSTELLFLNCKDMEDSVAADKVRCARIRDFVSGGGTLYASDWASDVVAAAFGDLVEFGPRDGETGTVSAKISDHYLARRLGNSIRLNFDAGGWVRVTGFPRDAQTYITDDENRPLAIGFMAGQGRVVYTSFHHHAQLSGAQPSDEEKILDWLVTLPTQHRLLLATSQVQARHRAVVRNQVVGNAGASKQLIPLQMGHGSGLGIFSLAWARDDRVQFSIRYLRDREIPAGEKRSSDPPLVMTVRNPGPRDGVEISRHLTGRAGSEPAESQPYVFAAGLRADLLEDSDWLASAVVRHLSGILGSGASLAAAEEIMPHRRVLDIIAKILSGLGYEIRLSANQARERPAEVLAWPLRDTDVGPGARAAIQVGVTMANRTRYRPDSERWVYPMRGELDPATERLLVSVALAAGRTDFDWADDAGPGDARSPAFIDASSDVAAWRPVSSATGGLSYERGLISDEEFRLNYHIDVGVYRAEPTPGHEETPLTLPQ